MSRAVARLAACLFLAGASNVALAADQCDFAPPRPILQQNAYKAQASVRKEPNELTEKAQLDSNQRIEIRQSACVDFVTTEFVIDVTSTGKRLPAGDDSWIALARRVLANLKTRGPANDYAPLNDFLKRASHLPVTGGTRAICRDGSTAAAGECSWDSLGGFIFSVTTLGQSTRISVTEYVSG